MVLRLISIKSLAFPHRHLFMFSDMTFTEVNDTVKQMAFHTFDYPSPDDYVQLFFEPSIEGMWFKVYIMFNDTPSINHFDYHMTVPKDLPEPMPRDQKEYLAQFKDVTAPYSYVLPKSYMNKTGPYTVGVLIHGKS